MRHLSWLILLGLMATPAAAQDPSVVSPDHYKVEIDNPWVKVLRFRQGPHEKTPMYELPQYAIVYLTDTDQKLVTPTGESRELHYKMGDSSCMDTAKQSQENLSDQPLEEIIVELKPDAPKGAGPVSPDMDPVKQEPQYVKVSCENDRIRILHTTLAAHVKNPLHGHPHNVVVFVRGQQPTVTTPEGQTKPNPRGPGNALWVEATQHATGNNSDTDALEIQVELK